MARRYNELLTSPTLVTKATCRGKLLNATVIALRNESYHVERIPVTKSLSEHEMDSATSFGLALESPTHSYTVAYVAQEEPEFGFLVKCGDAEAFARVFVQEDGGEVTVLKH